MTTATLLCSQPLGKREARSLLARHHVGRIAYSLHDHVARGAPLEGRQGRRPPAIYAVVTRGVSNTSMVAHPGGITDPQPMQVASYVWAVSHDQARP